MSEKVDYDYYITSINNLIKNIMALTPTDLVKKEELDRVIATLVDLKIKYQQLKYKQEEENV